MACPNCGGEFDDLAGSDHVDSGCLLGGLVGVVRDRGEVEIDPERIASFDVDALWSELLGPAADRVEATIERLP